MNIDQIVTVLFVLGSFGFVMWGVNGTIRGNLAERNWDSIQKTPINKWLHSGTNKETYIKQQRTVAWIMLPLVILFFGDSLWLAITSPQTFSVRKMFEAKEIRSDSDVAGSQAASPRNLGSLEKK